LCALDAASGDLIAAREYNCGLDATRVVTGAGDKPGLISISFVVS